MTIKKTLVMGGPITNLHFAMLERSAIDGLDGLVKRAPQAARLLLKLVLQMRPGASGIVVVSRETMRELMDVSMPTAERALRCLIQEGWVQRIRIGGANALAINSRVAWVGSRGDLQHAVFDATVIASRSEQDQVSLSPPPIRQVPIIGENEIGIPYGQSDPPAQLGLPDVEPVAAVASSGMSTNIDPPKLRRGRPPKIRIDPTTGEIIPRS